MDARSTTRAPRAPRWLSRQALGDVGFVLAAVLRSVFVVVLAIALATPALAVAQTNTAEISGTVVDQDGGVLPGATVVATHLASGLKVERVADAAGRFLLTGLAVGGYELEVHLDGFKAAVQGGITLSLGQRLVTSVTLSVGGVAETVTVTGAAPILQTATSEVSEVIRNEQVVNLPLNGRQFLQLALLTDNVVVPPGGTRGAALQQAGALFSVAGQRSGHNIYLLDGVKVTDEYFNNMVVSLSPDAIEEFKIQKTQYAAEFGGKAGALVNVATRSGTNGFRGSAVEFFRNDAFDAHNYFNDRSKPVPPLNQHQFGVSFGGPLRRDRTFFFGNYEGQRIRKSLTQTFSVPSDAVRAGNFAGLPTICDPTTIATTGACQPFLGNVVPANRIDPVARGMLARLVPAATSGEVQNLTSVENQRAEMDQASVRVDHRLGQADQVFVRVTAYDVIDRQPFGTSRLNETLVPGFGRSVTTTSRNLAASHTRVFGTRLLNELRFGWLDARGGQYSVNAGTDFARTVGLTGVTSDPRDVGFPQVSFSGQYTGFGDPTSFTTRNNRSFELYDNVTLDRSAHRIKVGGYLFHFAFRPDTPDFARGAFTYSGQFTGSPFADFLLGMPAVGQVGLGRGDEDGRTTWAHLFAQDDWRVTEGLTINAGLRIEFNRHMEAVDNRLSTVDIHVPGGRFVIASDDSGRINPQANAPLSSIPIPWVTSRDAGWDPSLLRPSYRRAAPRLGFAYRLPRVRETVVRGAFGIFLNQWAYSVQQAFARNLPFFFNKTIAVTSDARVPTFSTSSMLTSDATGTVGATIMDWDYRVEYNQTYTLDVQHALTPRTSIEFSVLASRTVGADSATMRNIPAPGPGPIGPRRPVPQLGPINAIRWDGWGLYHSATARLEHRLTGGLSVGANYTLSKSMDDGSDPGPTVAEANVPQNDNDMANERALSSYDHRHRFVANASADIPTPATWTGVTRALGASWRVSGIVTVQSGAPFTVNLGVDRANVGPGPAQRPNVSGNPNLSSGRTPDRWFDTSVFSMPDPFTFGNAGRNITYGPGLATVDVVFQKQAQLAPRLRLELRWEVFNLLNRTNFDLPNRIAFTPNFGRIFSAADARQMQFGGRLVF